MHSSLSGEIDEARLVPTFRLSGETSAVKRQVQALPPTSHSGETLMVCETFPLPTKISAVRTAAGRFPQLRLSQGELTAGNSKLNSDVCTETVFQDVSPLSENVLINEQRSKGTLHHVDGKN